MENAGEPTVNTENWTFRDLIGNSGTLTLKPIQTHIDYDLIKY